MSDPAPVTVALRIPGTWAHPKELLQQMPEGYRLAGESLILPDGTEIEFGAGAPDDQFAKIFRSSCRQPPTEEELAAVARYKVNVFLSGPGGSLEAARTMMRAGSSIVRAGGAGVFIDNSGLAHGGQNWLAMTDDGSPDALTFAFVSIISGQADVWTMGMHVLGLRDVIMKKADLEKNDVDIIDMIRYLAEGEQLVDDGHIIADMNGPKFRAFAEESEEKLTGSPMYNPLGRLKLVSMRDIAETN
jgi:hypothetical protein